MSIDTSLVQLAGLQSLDTLRTILSELAIEIAILKDERDEYRRKWLEVTKYNSIDIKQIPS